MLIQLVDKYQPNDTLRNIIAIASDHGGLDLKSYIIEKLLNFENSSHAIMDLGPYVDDRVDYPDYAAEVCDSIINQEASHGILICGSGIGMSIAANRHHGIRCALVNETVSAALSRAHNDSNVIALGARMIGNDMAWECIKTWLTTSYDSGRHDQRLAKLDCL